MVCYIEFLCNFGLIDDNEDGKLMEIELVKSKFILGSIVFNKVGD